MRASNAAAYWGPRAESVEESADRVLQFLTALAALDPNLASWRDGAASKQEALAQPPVQSTAADIVRRLRPERLHNEERFGYQVHWWNGCPDDDGPAAKLTMCIGGTTRIGSNNVILGLPHAKSAPHLYDPHVASEILRTLIAVFDPQWGVWSHSDLHGPQREPDRPTADGRGMVLGKLVGRPAGWANYLSDADTVSFDAALLPAGATVERVGNGRLVRLHQDPTDPALDDVLQLRRAMGYQVPAGESPLPRHR